METNELVKESTQEDSKWKLIYRKLRKGKKRIKQCMKTKIKEKTQKKKKYKEKEL